MTIKKIFVNQLQLYLESVYVCPRRDICKIYVYSDADKFYGHGQSWPQVKTKNLYLDPQLKIKIKPWNPLEFTLLLGMLLVANWVIAQ